MHFLILQKAPSAILAALILLFLHSDHSRAQGCAPNDPFGSNPGTLCFTFIHSLAPSSTFQSGYARQGFFGRAVTPLEPGLRLIDKPLRNEYFTHVRAESGVGVTIKTSTERSWTIKEVVE